MGEEQHAEPVAEEFKRTDLDLVEVLVGSDVRARAAVIGLRGLLKNATFPIADLDGLLEAVPKEGLRFREFTMSREDVKAFAPPSLFPIATRERLIALAVQAVRQLEPPQLVQVSPDELLAPNVPVTLVTVPVRQEPGPDAPG
jgi:hypothetical protein